MRLQVLFLSLFLMSVSGSEKPQSDFCISSEEFDSKYSKNFKQIKEIRSDPKSMELKPLFRGVLYDYEGTLIFEKLYLLDSEMNIKTAETEVETLNLLKGHKNALQIYLCVRDASKVRIFTEALDQNVIPFYNKSIPKSFVTRLTFAVKLTDEIVYLHAKGRVHGDLKMENLMVTKSGADIKLIDFGSSVLNGTRTTGYTHRYAAPELARRSSNHLATFEQDVWAWTVTLALLLFWDRFEALDAAKVKSIDTFYTGGIMRAMLQIIQQVSLEIEVPFVNYFKKWLKADPKRRPKMLEVADDLRNLLKLAQRFERRFPQAHVIR